MSKFSYYKRVVEGKTVQLHMLEDREEFTVGKVFPENEENIVYNGDEMVEMVDVNEWLDAGIECKIFDTTPTPKQPD